MSNSFIMTESIVRPAKMPYGRLKDNGFVGIEGEHAARALVVETKDDLSTFASINLIIDDLDCGAMTKTTSGGTTTLSKVLTSSMIGRSGRKICQLIMVNSGNTVVQKSSQFEAYVGRANEIERSVDDGVTIIILSEAVTEMAREAAAAAAEEAVADVVEDCQAIADAASASADAAAQSASDAQTAAASIVVDATLDPTSTHAIQNKAVAGAISELSESLGDVRADLDETEEILHIVNGGKETKSGEEIAITDAKDALVDVDALTVDILYEQAGSGDPSPTNIRPITGFTGAGILVNGSDKSVSWQSEAGTVYKGTLDVLTGLLTVTHVGVDLGDYDYTLATDAWRSTTQLPYLHKTTSNDYDIPSGACSNLKMWRWNALANTSGLISIGASSYSYRERIGISKDFGDNPTAVKTALTGQKLVYELQTPLTYQLTAQTISTVYGDNSLSVDCGSLTVTYTSADKSRFNEIESNISGLENMGVLSGRLAFESGWINAQGQYVDDATRCRTSRFYSTSDYNSVVMVGFNGYIDYFNADFSLSDYWSMTDGVPNEVIKTYPYFKILARTAIPATAKANTVAELVNATLYKYIKRNSNDIVANNHDLDLIFPNFLRRVNETPNSYTSNPKVLTLLHFSDLHGSENIKRILQYKAYKGNDINSVVCSGDIVYSHYTDSMTFWDGSEGIEDVLLCMGNHDQSLNTDYDNALSEADAYTKYFAPYIANWGVSYTEGKTYWYKDYPNNNIRLIAINSNYDSDSDQLTFLTNALSGAKTLGYTVVCMAHYTVIQPYKINCNFTAIDREIAAQYIGDAYMSAVQDYIDGGGDFACWIGGHTHCDFIVKSATYPDQIGVVVTCAYTSSMYSDQTREDYKHSQDAFNILGIDVNSKTVKLMRVGADSDCYTRSRKTFCINYQTQEILAQN